MGAKEIRGSRFTLTIELGNDALQTGNDLAEVLQRVASVVDGIESLRTSVAGGRIRDVNGNTVGRWEVAP